MTQLIAVKLGSTMTTIFKQGEGLVLKEPSCIAVSSSGRDREIKAVGNLAKRMQGRTTGSVSVVYPINNGVVTDTELASSLLKIYLKRISPRKFFKPQIRAILCTPLGLSIKERKAFEKVCYSAGIADVVMIPGILCSALGDDIDISGSSAKMLVGIGGGTTNIAVTMNNSIVSGINLGIGGTLFVKAIERHIAEKFNVKLSELSAEKIKLEVMSLLPNDGAYLEVQGINQVTNETELLTISSRDVYPVAEEYFGKIAEAIASVISSLPPDLIADINREGIYFFGSNSAINGIVKFFYKKLGMKIIVSETFKTDIHGAAKLLDNDQLLRNILKNL